MRRTPRRPDLFALITGLFVTLMFVLIALPIGRMIARAFIVQGQLSLTTVSETLSQQWVAPVIGNTVLLVAMSTLLSLLVGAGLAWLNERTDADLGIVGAIAPVLPFFMPGVAVAIGWVLIAAPRVGFLNSVISMLPGVGRGGLNWGVNIYSWGGLIWLYTLHGVPYVYFIVAAALRNLDPSLEEASIISGAGTLRTMWRVSIPAVRPAMLSAALLVAISGFAMYALPVVIATPARIDLLPVYAVRLVRNTYPPRIDQAIVLGLINLVIVGSIWIVQRRFAAAGQFVKLGGRASGARPIPLGAVKWPARTLALLYMACASLLPLAALVIVAFQPFWTPRIQASLFTLENFRTVLFKNDLTRMAFWNSVKLALIGATLATAITLVISIYTTRSKTLMARLVDGIVKAPATISALVISIGFLVTFSGPPFMLGGTLLLLLLAYVVIYMPSASIAVDAAVLQVGNDLLEASQVSGAVDSRTVRKIVLPLVIVGLTAGWSMVFVHIMGDLSASALLAAVGSPVVGYALLDVWESGSFTLLAAYATLICVAITIVVTSVTALARWYGRNR